MKQRDPNSVHSGWRDICRKKWIKTIFASFINFRCFPSAFCWVSSIHSTRVTLKDNKRLWLMVFELLLHPYCIHSLGWETSLKNWKKMRTWHKQFRISSSHYNYKHHYNGVGMCFCHHSILLVWLWRALWIDVKIINNQNSLCQILHLGWCWCTVTRGVGGDLWWCWSH